MEYLYKTKFERMNFTYKPTVKQTCEVVFSIEHDEVIDENEHEFCGKAWDALREQCNWKNDDKLPHGGWSSAMQSFEFERIEIPHNDREVELPDDHPVIACTFSYKDSGYRATGFYKVVPFDRYPKGDLTSELLKELAIEKDTVKPDYKIIHCLPEEAHIISGAGVGGCVASIKDIEIEGMVEWDDLTIKQAQGDYVNSLKRFEDGFDRLDSDLSPKCIQYFADRAFGG